MQTLWLLVIGITSMLGCVPGERTTSTHVVPFFLVERVGEAETRFDETLFRSARKHDRFVNAVTMEGRTERLAR